MSRPDVAAAGFAGQAATAYAAKYPGSRAAEQKTEAFYSQDEGGDLCWIPSSGPADAQQTLDSLVLDPTLVRDRRSLPFSAYYVAKEMALAREDYLTRIAHARDLWLKNGSAVNEAIAKELSEARFALKQANRRLYNVSGFFAKSFEVAREFVGSENTRAVVSSRLMSGEYGKVVDGAFKTNRVANQAASFARSAAPLAKALGIGGTVVMATDIPYQFYRLYSAQSNKDIDDAFVKLTEATVGTVVAATCLAVGIGSGGVGFLACGLAPVAAGVFAGRAAEVVLGQVR